MKGIEHSVSMWDGSISNFVMTILISSIIDED